MRFAAPDRTQKSRDSRTGTGQATTVVVPPEQADVARPAGAIISFNATTGATVDQDSDVTFLANPDEDNMPVLPTPTVVQELTDRLLNNNPASEIQQWPRDTVEKLSIRCLRMAELRGVNGLDECSGQPIYPPANDQRTAADHTFEAIFGIQNALRKPTEPKPFQLTYGPQTRNESELNARGAAARAHQECSATNTRSPPRIKAERERA